jgi:hydrogenase/urease accessory protein HupE
MLSTIKTLYAACLALAVLLCAVPAQAHDPFDGSTQVQVLDERIEARVTLGYDAARAMLHALGLGPDQASTIVRGGEEAALPPAAGARLLRLYAGRQELAPGALSAAGGRDEVTFRLRFARPPAGRLAARASYFEAIDAMRPGTLVVLDAHRRVLASTLLSPSTPLVAIPDAPAPSTTGFLDFFKLGVEHILTGFDHLLFLCALLLTLTRIGQMLGIVTAFTLAHSLTLALAALGMVALPASVVEPLIALSIIVACIDNLVRREAMLAQEGEGVLEPLLAFNLGVEAGQLLVAASLIALLVLLRRREGFLRYGAPALSGLVIMAGSWWLLERLHLV